MCAIKHECRVRHPFEPEAIRAQVFQEPKIEVSTEEGWDAGGLQRMDWSCSLKYGIDGCFCSPPAWTVAAWWTHSTHVLFSSIFTLKQPLRGLWASLVAVHPLKTIMSCGKRRRGHGGSSRWTPTLLSSCSPLTSTSCEQPSRMFTRASAETMPHSHPAYPGSL